MAFSLSSFSTSPELAARMSMTALNPYTNLIAQLVLHWPSKTIPNARGSPYLTNSSTAGKRSQATSKSTESTSDSMLSYTIEVLSPIWPQGTHSQCGYESQIYCVPQVLTHSGRGILIVWRAMSMWHTGRWRRGKIRRLNATLEKGERKTRRVKVYQWGWDRIGLQRKMPFMLMELEDRLSLVFRCPMSRVTEHMRCYLTLLDRYVAIVVIANILWRTRKWIARFWILSTLV